MKKDAFYFPHYCNARHDRKIKRIQKDLGLEGYGIFFMLLEVLREQTNFTYPYCDLDLLADEFGTSLAKLEVVINNYQLFTIDENKMFFSPKLIVYLQPYFNMRNQKQLAAMKSVEARQKKKSTTVERPLNDSTTTVERPLNDSTTTVERPLNDSTTTVEQINKVNKEIKEIKESKEDRNVAEKTAIKTNATQIFRLMNEMLGGVAVTNQRRIESFLEDGIEPDVIIFAMNDSVGKDRADTYCISILEKCLSENIKKSHQYIERKRIFEKKKAANLAKQNKIPSHENFDQREYAEGEWEKFYINPCEDLTQEEGGEQ